MLEGYVLKHFNMIQITKSFGDFIFSFITYYVHFFSNSISNFSRLFTLIKKISKSANGTIFPAAVLLWWRRRRKW